LKQKDKEQLEKFEKFLQIVKGRKDVKSRVAVLANPDNPKSMSVLTRGQSEFVAISCFLASNKTWGEMWKPLEGYAYELMAVSPSVGGQGREQSIRFVGALSESGFLKKLGINVKGEEKE